MPSHGRHLSNYLLQGRVNITISLQRSQGDLAMALAHISEYFTGSQPPFGTPQVLNTVADTKSGAGCCKRKSERIFK